MEAEGSGILTVTTKNGSLGVIVARGGSKRVPRKILREVAGHPVIAWMVRAALNSRLDRVIVSTEDAEIAEIARRYGAEVPFLRPVELAEDTVRNDAVLLHALGRAEEVGGRYDTVVLLQSAAPFTQPEDIDRCVETLASSDANCVFAVRPVKEQPTWMFRRGPDGAAVRFLGGDLIGKEQLTQGNEALFLPAGSVWAIRTAALRAHQAVYAAPVQIVEVPFEHAVDLDDEIDFDVATAVAARHSIALWPLPGARGDDQD
ncbi:acylneuraminate cytidylyltransferase family protein [Rhodospirillaceae bacterium KN72]|uniref:Acylneuraminate cytidylyltransferase family protein n=1 Tax=Pacificispira spongiicola TaxID=2729598 RepID=A0A7Y0HHK5_9PROT|nr:acylneuraminate cytidylyltransferase family protein [Pacificispira spongiicola]NMM45579.1 acylneuraminate cytidylyltransferase family protein [Pacificispira spongiicola]